MASILSRWRPFKPIVFRPPPLRHRPSTLRGYPSSLFPSLFTQPVPPGSEPGRGRSGCREPKRHDGWQGRGHPQGAGCRRLQVRCWGNAVVRFAKRSVPACPAPRSIVTLPLFLRRAAFFFCPSRHLSSTQPRVDHELHRQVRQRLLRGEPEPGRER